MTKNDKIQALKPLKSEFNKLSNSFDRILRYPCTERKNISDKRELKMFGLLVKMGVVFNQMKMIVDTPMPDVGDPWREMSSRYIKSAAAKIDEDVLGLNDSKSMLSVNENNNNHGKRQV